MRWWVALPLLSCPCAALAMPVARPLASRFDLTALAVRAPLTAGTTERARTGSRWLGEAMGPPPGPAHGRAKLRIRGKKVKFRMPF
jgi:hypothetical protein